MNTPAVSVVIPVWNGREMLLRLLDKLSLQTYPIAEVIVADNGSEDGAPEAAAERGARVLRMGSNRGFSRAVNAGIEACGSELIAVVNSDVEPEPEWLARLAGALQSGEAWFASGKILSASPRGHHIDGTYDLISRGACACRMGQGRPDSGEFSRGGPIAMAPATASLFRAALFGRVGLFDPAFESYLEDVDLGLRCAMQRLRGVYVPTAIAYHWGSASLGAWNPEMVRLIARNQVFLVAKHYSPGLLRRYRWPILVGQSLWGLLALRHGAGGAFLRGKIEGLRRFRSMRSAGDGGDLAKIVEQSELEIAEAQRRSGSDWYWRVYFLLTVGRKI
jgi:GT2 family glycosyltransferase